LPTEVWTEAVLLETATALCATVNLAYFVSRLLSPLDESRERRVAAFVLAVVSLGVAGDAGGGTGAAAARRGAPERVPCPAGISTRSRLGRSVRRRSGSTTATR
jgi:hypothetical protein